MGQASPPDAKYTDAKTLRQLQRELDELHETLMKAKGESAEPKTRAVLEKYEPVMRVEIHPSSVGILGDPLPVKDCRPSSLWGRAQCYYKVKVVAPQGLSRSAVVLESCVDDDGASVYDSKEERAFAGKSYGDMVRGSYGDFKAKKCWDGGGQKIVLKVQTDSSSGADTPSAGADPKPSDDTNDTPPAGKTATFPEVVQSFIDMTEIQQKAFASTFEGTVLSGSGELFDVSKCGWTDDSKKYGSDCYKVTLDSGVPRVVLYFPKSKEAQMATFTKGNSYNFKNCVGISIRDWGAWSTATCDMP